MDPSVSTQKAEFVGGQTEYRNQVMRWLGFTEPQ
jgi:hypothetical protein